jgi:(R,R)-butanediol dehydrogenase/meso-butanediol dehydrogenase/diacetyl reductase
MCAEGGMKARAQVLVGPGEFELRELDVPAPGPGELRMRVHACGICGSDKVLAHTSPPGTVLGHEVIAEVESCGPGATGWHVGDRAIPVGDHIGMGGGRLGGFSEWIVVAAEVCVRVPAPLPSRHAVLGEPMGNGLHFVRRGRLQPGQCVAIFGAGQIGLAILFWARRLGAQRIVVSEPALQRARLARQLGADAVLDPTHHTDIAAAMSAALGGRPQLVFEATGRPDVMRDAIPLVAPGGGAVVIAGITLEEIAIRPVALVLKETDLIFPLGTVREEVEEVIAVLARGELPAERFISHRISQAAIPAALEELGRPTDQIKVVVEYA